MTNMNMDKRRLRRMPGSLLGEVALQLDAESVILPASSYNYSVQGIGVVVRYDASIGKHAIIHLLFPQRTVKIDADVRHVTPMENEQDQWLLGCEFSRLLTSDDL